MPAQGNDEKPQEPSSDPSISRQEFIGKVVSGAARTGSLMAVPVILDVFLVPKAYAANSTNCARGDITSGRAGSSGDVGQNGNRSRCNVRPPNRTFCFNGNDYFCYR